MRTGTSLISALVLVGTLANAARAQLPPGIPTTAPSPYSGYGPGLKYQDSSYRGPYSVYGPGLKYQDSSYVGPYSGRLSSASQAAPTQTGAYSSSRPTGLMPPTEKQRALGDAATRADGGRAPASGAGLGPARPRYVRINIAGNAIQAIVVP
jgi:hypothetical protein